MRKRTEEIQSCAFTRWHEHWVNFAADFYIRNEVSKRCFLLFVLFVPSVAVQASFIRATFCSPQRIQNIIQFHEMTSFGRLVVFSYDFIFSRVKVSLTWDKFTRTVNKSSKNISSKAQDYKTRCKIDCSDQLFKKNQHRYLSHVEISVNYFFLANI